MNSKGNGDFASSYIFYCNESEVIYYCTCGFNFQTGQHVCLSKTTPFMLLQSIQL